MNQQTSIPPFSLYSVGNQCTKSCYQAQNIIVLCDIAGPYFERNKLTVDPIFNCNIIGSTLSQQKICYINKIIKQIANLTIVKEKYLRMNFDLNFHFVEQKNQSQILPALINLLCFSFIVFGVEIKSLFSCAQIWLNEEKIQWKNGTQNEDNRKMMCMVIQSSQKQIIYSKFKGQFAFVHFQRMSNLLMDANQQIFNYIIKKITEINQQHQG